MIDFTNCEKNKFKAYGGRNGNKFAIKYNGEDYMLKFPSKNELDTSYTNGVYSEYLACKIIKSMGLNVQDVILGKYFINGEYKVCVACKDFTDNDTVLKEFSFFKNKEFGTSGYSTDLDEVLQAIRNQDIYDRDKLNTYFWDLFVVDAFLGNFDRHNGNWGFLINNREQTANIAPIYDCGSCLYPGLTDDLVKKVIHSPSEIDKRVIVFPNSALKANDKKINYYNLIKSRKYADLNKAVLRIYPKINLDKIFRIIDSVESLDIDRKLFYKGILFARYEMILSPAYDALVKREDRKASAIADYEIVSSVKDY